jgi:hypothetical protein
MSRQWLEGDWRERSRAQAEPLFEGFNDRKSPKPSGTTTGQTEIIHSESLLTLKAMLMGRIPGEPIPRQTRSRGDFSGSLRRYGAEIEKVSQPEARLPLSVRVRGA